MTAISKIKEADSGLNITTAEEIITPGKAEEILNGNRRNRKISPKRVAILSAQMTSGAWQMNGESIKISDTGALLDGQHRLAAVIDSGVPCRTLVTRGLPEASMTTLGTGRTRSAADVLGINGYSNVALLASSAASLWRIISPAPAISIVPADYVMKVADRYPRLQYWVSRYAGSKVLKKLVPGSAFIPALVYLDEIAGKRELAEKLFFDMEIGTGLTVGDPSLALRNRMMRLSATKGSDKGFFMVWSGLALTLDAIEAGTKLERVQLSPDAGTPRAPKALPGHLMHLTAYKRLTDLPRGNDSYQLRVITERVSARKTPRFTKAS